MAKPPPIESLWLCDDDGELMPIGPRIAEPVPLGLPKRRRQTAEKQQRIELGKHPLVGLPLHPQAPADTNRAKRKPQPFTCGSCLHLHRAADIVRSELECEIAVSKAPVRRWWPGCIQFKPRAVVATTSDEQRA